MRHSIFRPNIAIFRVPHRPSCFSVSRVLLSVLAFFGHRPIAVSNSASVTESEDDGLGFRPSRDQAGTLTPRVQLPVNLRRPQRHIAIDPAPSPDRNQLIDPRSYVVRLLVRRLLEPHALAGARVIEEFDSAPAVRFPYHRCHSFSPWVVRNARPFCMPEMRGSLRNGALVRRHQKVPVVRPSTAGLAVRTVPCGRLRVGFHDRRIHRVDPFEVRRQRLN